MAMKQHEVINIIKEPSNERLCDIEGEKGKIFHSRFGSHFELVHIAREMQNFKNAVTFLVPRIQLFLDENARNMFLNYTADSKDPNVQRFRALLLDTENLEKRVRTLVGKMKEECERLELPVYEFRTMTYLPENMKTEGARVTYRIAIDGSKSNVPGVIELNEFLEAPVKNK